MDICDETYSKSKSDNVEFKNFSTPSYLSRRNSAESEDGIDLMGDNKSVNAMKKIYSIDRIAFRSTISKMETLTSNEKLTKGSKLFRTSSTFLDRSRCQPDYIDVSKMSIGMDQRYQKSGNDLFCLDLLDMKKYALTNYIQENPKAADLKWSLFCAACHSYRYDSVLRPFPHMFLDGDIKNIDKLRDVAESCPSIKVLYGQIQERNSSLISVDLINLLYWVLIHVREPELRFIPKEMHENILSRVMSTSTAAAPHYIFQVLYGKQNENQKFNELARNYKIIHAFHGSRLDNFYSILNYGLKISFNKLSPFGPGIHLSSEMNVTLPHSQAGFSWGGSYFGSQISIVALCELIDHPDIKYPDDALKKRKKNKFMTDFGTLPDKEFIVQNSDLVRVKYLLIYCNSFPQPCSNQLSAIITWFQKNKVIAVVVAYVFLLMAIATSNNSSVYKYYRRLFRKFGFKMLKW